MQVVVELINKKADIEAKSNSGYTPLIEGIFLNLFNSIYFLFNYFSFFEWTL